MTTIFTTTNKVALVFLALSGILAVASPAHGQVDAEGARPLLVTAVHFQGNTVISDEELREQIQTHRNSLFLGIPGFTWWLWLHEWGRSGVLGERVGAALMASGEAPAYVNEQVLRTDVERLRRFYMRHGFRESRIEVDVDTVRADTENSVEVRFDVERGPATFICGIRYAVDGALAETVREDLGRESELMSAFGGQIGTRRCAVEARRYSEEVLRNERGRILALLRRNGYALATRDSMRAVVEPRQDERGMVDVAFRIHPGQRYRLGDVHVVVTGTEASTAMRRDTMAVGTGQLTVRVQDETAMDTELIRRAMDIRPGQWYNEEAMLRTKRALESAGVFSYTNLVVVPQNAEMRNGQLHAPVRVELHTLPRHQLGFDTFVQQRRGGVLDAGDNQLGAGVGVSYENINLFGGGEKLRLEATSALAFGAEADLLTAARAEMTASLVAPYLTFPFDGLLNALSPHGARTRLSLGVLTARNDRLRLIIRGRGRARAQIELQHSQTLTSWLDVFDLTISNPDTLSGFQQRFLSHLIGPDDDMFIADPVQRAQIISDYTHPQINDAFRYTLRAADMHPIRRSDGYRYELSVETGGNLSALLDRSIFTPGRQEGTLPGLPFFDDDQSGSARLRYRPYARVTVDLRRYHAFSPEAVLAGRAMGGMALATGYSDLVPFDRRFYSGGATSVRGWRLRELGPGATRLAGAIADAGRDVTSLLGGNVKLQASVEMRRLLIRDVLEAEWWSVLFVDIGNVWFGPRNPGYRGYEPVQGARDAENAQSRGSGHFRLGSFLEEFGVGGGAGLRADWRFLVLRLDLAFRLYDPAFPSEGFLPDNYERPVVHFGIGHTF